MYSNVHRLRQIATIRSRHYNSGWSTLETYNSENIIRLGLLSLPCPATAWGGWELNLKCLPLSVKLIAVESVDNDHDKSTSN